MPKASNPTIADINQTFGAIGNVRRAALPHVKSMNLFTQGIAGEANAIMRKAGQGDGICCALSLYWLAAQKKQSQYLATVQAPGGSANVDQIKRAIKLQNDVSKNPESQLEACKAWLLKQNFCNVDKVCGSPALATNGIGAWFAQTTSEVGPYRILKTGGYWHVMALDLTNPENPVFFDPNLGSFEFRSTVALATFLNDTMFPMSQSYGNDVCHYIGNQNFKVTIIERLSMT